MINKKLSKAYLIIIFLFLIPTINANNIYYVTETSKESISIYPINGITFYVGGDGLGNFSKIQEAIENSSDGDTVFVYEDLSPYNENIEITKSIHLEGENKQTTIIDGQGNGDTVYCEADNVQIHGFTINNGYKPGGNWWAAGIQLYICNFCIIFDNILIDNFYGIRLYGAENCTITNNTINSNKNMGIWLHSLCHYSVITNNIIENNVVSGIKIEGAFNCLVDENTIRYNPWDGIRLDRSAHTIISNNEITENGYNAIVARLSYENTIINNNFTKNGLLISQVYLVNNTVKNNIVNGKPLVYLTDGSDKIIDNAGQVILLRCNRITVKNLNISNIFYGIQTYTCNDCVITNNTLKNNFEGIYIGYDYPEISKNLKITKNEIVENKNGIFLGYCVNAELTENTIKNNLRSAINVSGKKHKISKNIIVSNSEGIYIRGSKHIITKNIIEENKQGIFADRLTYCFISGNDIKNNENGMYLFDSQKNIISKNNIFNSNYNDAFFIDSLKNIWRKNYWNKPFGPKIIFGLKYYYPSIWGPPNIISVFWFDFRPARKPYNIRTSEII